MGHNHKQFTIKQSSYYRSQNAYRNFALGLFSFLCAYLVASIFTPVKQSDAAQLLDITNDSTGYYVRITGSDTLNIPVTATPTGQLAGASDTITTTTNSPKGYKLFISASPNYLYLNGDSTTSSQGKFSPIGGSLTTPLSLGQNTWGFAYNTTNTGVVESNFAPAASYTSPIPASIATYTSVPTTETMVQSIDEANIPSGTNLDIYFGIKASTSLPSGSYQGQITYTALSDGVTGNIMQDFTTAECQALPIATADNYDTAHIELVDSRDLKWYSVAHMADGNCWMTSNLALDGGITLTPDDSNVSQNRELPASANITDGTTSVYDSPQIYTATQDATTTDCNSRIYCIINNTKYGNLYNWNAATATTGKQATTGTAYESICPKGWRLPDQGSITTDKSYAKLMYAVLGFDQNWVTGETGGPYVVKAQTAPLYFAFTGHYYNTRMDLGIGAPYWSRTVYSSDTNQSTYLAMHNGRGDFVSGATMQYKSYGFPVRCVFQGSTIENNMFMQDINLTMCNNLAESTTTSDNRRTVIDGRDGKSYKVSHLADGNCWMVSNLAINNKTVQSVDSDFESPSTYTIPAGITATTDWNTNNYTTKKVEVAHGLGQYATSDSSYYGEVFYNWTVAVAKETTAGVTTAPNTSICPKGWTLPTNGDRGVNKSWAKLLDVYGVTTGAQLLTKPLGFTLYYGNWSWKYASEVNQGLYSDFWSGTPSSETNAYFLSYNSSDVYPQNNNSKGNGFSIRCLLSY